MIERVQSSHRHASLFGQLRWFVRLRSCAAVMVMACALADRYWWGRYPGPWGIFWLGAAILGYNGFFRLVLRASPARVWRRSLLVTLAWGQIMADLACLTLLVLWTDGLQSPALGFFVFHMVIASLLLRPVIAYIGAGISALMIAGGLWVSGQGPGDTAQAVMLLGWVVTLLVTVYLASNITRMLRRHRRRVLRQSQRIRLMSQKLRNQQQAMVQQEKMTAMGQMAAGVAHEIANPLASMDSLLQLMQRRGSSPSEGVVERLREQIDRINRIVRQLTSFAHPAEQQQRETSIDDMVARVLQMVRFDPRVRKVRMEIQREVPAGHGLINAKPHALEQVLVNLILNALDAVADQAKPRIDIRVGQNGRECFVEVSDNGCGIASEHMNHLFEPFFTTKAVGKGTGLGLAISYRTVRDHDGKIDVESRNGKTRFTVRLPRVGTFS